MNTKQIKEVAVLVGALAGIVTGIEKIKSTLLKWREEAKESYIEKTKPEDEGDSL